MGASKMEFYTDHQIEIANRCKALGHPARVAIVEKLMENETLNCSDLQFYIPLAQSTISRHLKELFTSGILGYTVVGNNCFYHINRQVIQEISKYLAQINLITSQKESMPNVYFIPKVKQMKPYFMRV